MDSFSVNLSKVARELKKLNDIREFCSEFEKEKSNVPLLKNESCKMETNQEAIKDLSLKMEVYEDKDYDIEEIKFWNFMSKNKSHTKPSIVKTSVYKVPESQYVVREVSVKVNSKEKLKASKEKNQEIGHNK